MRWKSSLLSTRRKIIEKTRRTIRYRVQGYAASPTSEPVLGESVRSPFFAEISFITSILRSRSATGFFNLVFSTSSALRRFTSSLAISPKRLRQA